MNFDLSKLPFDLSTLPLAMPSELDMGHVSLILLVFVLIVIAVLRGSVKAPAETKGHQNEQEAVEEKTASTKAAVKPMATPSMSPPQVQLRELSPDAALQLLALLQKEARFIDFSQEDLADFSDADIGAAARVVHEGSRKAIQEYFDLSPILDAEEESEISIEAGFDASQIRLTGNVVGEPPFKGTVVHRGWKVTAVKLPKLADAHDAAIVAPSEVEL